MESFKNIAVLIDADNTQLSKIESALNEISAYGRITVKKAYGNWNKKELSNWETNLKRLAIKAEQQFDYVSGKNATDIALIIDAMDLLHSGSYDAFVLVSSDSDFSPLAIRLRESGAYIIGVGRETTPEAFKNSCDNFIIVENLDKTEEIAKPITPNSKSKKNTVIPKPELSSNEAEIKSSKKKNDGAAPINEIHALLKKCYVKYQDNDGYANVSTAGSYLQRVKPDFDTRTYNFSKLSDLLIAFPEKYEVKVRRMTSQASIIYYKCLD